MKRLVVLTLTFLTSSVFASEAILTCGNQDAQNPMFISVWDGESLDSLGQVSLKVFHSVNLICNNASVLKSLGKDIICAGVDRTPVVAAPTVISETIAATAGGYKWRGFNCW